MSKKMHLAAVAFAGWFASGGAWAVECKPTDMRCEVPVKITPPASGSDNCKVEAPEVKVLKRDKPLILVWSLAPTSPGTDFRFGTAGRDGIAFTGNGHTWFAPDGAQRQQVEIRKILRAGGSDRFSYYIRTERGPVGSPTACTDAGPVVVNRD